MRVVTFLGEKGRDDTRKVQIEGREFLKGIPALVRDSAYWAHPFPAQVVYNFTSREALVSDMDPKPIVFDPALARMDITAIIPNYRTKNMTRAAITSLKTFYPDLPLIVVDDGSQDDSTAYIQRLPIVWRNTQVLILETNEGQGTALDLAIKWAKTRCVFTMDSDIVIRQGGFLEAMEAMLYGEDLYGIGVIYQRDAVHGNQYLSCVASLYDREKYLTLPPFEHHGDPMQVNMDAAARRGMRVKCFPIFDYLDHREAGTREAYAMRWDLTKDQRALIYGNTYLTAAVCSHLLKLGSQLVGYVPCVDEPTVPGRMPIERVDEKIAHDLKLSIQYDRRISIDRPAYNVHTGLLPEWGGKDILYHALRLGATEQGLTFHAMTEYLDFGPIISKITYPVLAGDSIVDLYERLAAIAPGFVAAGMRLVGVLGSEGARRCPRIEPRMYHRAKIPASEGGGEYDITPTLLREKFN